jgi:hypothetical protein
MEAAQNGGDFETAGKIQYQELPAAEEALKAAGEKAKQVKLIKEEVTNETIASIVSR